MSIAIQKTICPICGKEQNEAEFSECNVCKFPFPYVSFWASSKSLELWNKKVQEYKKQYETLADDNIINKLILRRDSVGILKSKDNSLSIIYGDGRKVGTYNNVIKFISTNNNSAFLFSDGKVMAEEDNTYGQCNLQGYTDIKDIGLSASCTFLVGNDGSLTAVGSISAEMKAEIALWNDIIAVSASEYLLVAVTNTNSLRVSSSKSADINKDIISEWKDVIKVCVYGDKCIALIQDGTVRASWIDEYTEKLGDLKNIKDILYDGTYIIALDSDGNVHLNGKAKNKLLDAGRAEASQWKNIVSLSCSNYAICGYDSEGNLYIAGKVGGKNHELINEWNKEIKPL